MASAAPAANDMRCCGIAAPDAAEECPAKPPAAAMWDAMAGWYCRWMMPSTVPLAFELFGQLGLLSPEGQQLRVLETHCGSALAASMLLRSGTAPVAEYRCTDVSEAMLQRARENFEGAAGVPSFVAAASTALPEQDFPTASFDRYLSNLGGCCVEDLRGKLREARRVLSPGGIAAMSMRIEDPAGEFGDTSMGLVARSLSGFGFPPPPTRESLHLGKDLPRLREVVTSCGFTKVRAWRTLVPIAGVRDMEGFREWTSVNPQVTKMLGALPSDEKRAEARAELDRHGKEVLEGRGDTMQLAAVVVVAEAA